MPLSFASILPYLVAAGIAFGAGTWFGGLSAKASLSQEIAKQANLALKRTEDLSELKTEFHEYRDTQKEILATAEREAQLKLDAVLKGRDAFRLDASKANSKYQALLKERGEVACTMSSAAQTSINDLVDSANRTLTHSVAPPAAVPRLPSPARPAASAPTK